MDFDLDTAALFAGLGSEEQRVAWEGLVRRALKGEATASLIHHDSDGLPIQPLYTAEDAPGLPFLGRADAQADRPWDIRAAVTDADAPAANASVLEDLQGGATSVSLALDPADPARLDVGSAAALAQVLDGVLLDIAPVALDAGFLGPDAAAWLADAAKGGPASPLAFHLDPLGTFARQGSSPGPVEAHLDRAAATAVRLAQVYPKASAFLASGVVVHEAGGSRAQELAFAIGSALAYAKAMAAAGLTLEQAFSRIVLGVSLDNAFNAGVCKLRAARLMWRRLTEACGVAVPARVEARASRRMLSRRDAWTNLLRLTAAGFSGAVGGADALVLEPFTQPLGPASPQARRQARNIQLLLMEEARLGEAPDPAGGAWTLERLTLDLAKAGWCGFQAIEAQGGLLAALKSGALQADVHAVRDQTQARFAEGRVILGANRHLATELPEPAVAVTMPKAAAPDPRLPGPDDRCAALPPIRWSAPFERGSE